MALRFRWVSGGAKGKSTWKLVHIEGESETVIAKAPQNYGTERNYEASIKRFKKAFEKAVQVEYVD